MSRTSILKMMTMFVDSFMLYLYFQPRYDLLVTSAMAACIAEPGATHVCGHSEANAIARHLIGPINFQVAYCTNVQMVSRSPSRKFY